jgi:hypothetical protein
MELRCIVDNAARWGPQPGRWYDWKAIQYALNKVGPCALKLKFEQFPGKIEINGTWMSKKCMLEFLKWYAETCSCEHRQVVNGVFKALKPKRVVSKKYRWIIAWKQEYKCAVCQELMHPKAMDIDHIVELCRGGEDTVENCQALCANCHAKKSRGVFSKYFN